MVNEKISDQTDVRKPFNATRRMQAPPTVDLIGLGRRIADRRDALGLTQKTLGVALGKKEVSAQGYVATIEGGQGAPAGDVLLRLPLLLNCDGDWLLTGKGDPERKESVGWKLEAMREILEAKEELGDVASSIRRLLRQDTGKNKNPGGD